MGTMPGTYIAGLRFSPAEVFGKFYLSPLEKSESVESDAMAKYNVRIVVNLSVH